ncbi:MAG: OmpA family protein [Candidatus Krumholzibacteriaceae bacterium]|jgi:outer membrane protein OmpA-like peptidoglycan-associated protein
MRNLVIFALIAALLAGAVGCASLSKTKEGTAIGAGAGAVIGGLIGNQTGHTALGAILGAAVGGAAGAYIGNYMDKQAEEMQKDIQGAKIERVGEGIKITFDSGILFDVDKAELKPVAKDNLTKMATILNKYPDTNVLIEGHTDSTGTYEHNLALSKERAQSVANFLAGLGVNPSRFATMGYGPSQPVAPNTIADGRQQNRRVELAVMANDKLKKAAEKQTSGG